MAGPARGEITGLILAGGRGSRLGGVDKGWAPYRGQPLIEHVIARLAPQVGGLILSANRSRERYAALGWPVVADADAAYSGPLAGMLAGLTVAPTGFVAVVPCDAPELPVDLVARLGASIGSAAAAVAVAADRPQPTFCLLRTGLKDHLASALAKGERRTGAWLAAVGAQPVGFADAAAFANLNTAADFTAVGA